MPSQTCAYLLVRYWRVSKNLLITAILALLIATFEICLLLSAVSYYSPALLSSALTLSHLYFAFQVCVAYRYVS